MKYKLNKSDTIVAPNGATLYRIIATTSFKNHAPDMLEGVWIAAGDKGGYVQSKKNLSQDGTAWIADDAMVYDDALITKNAYICQKAKVFDDAVIGDFSWISGKAQVFGHARIWDYANICGNAKVYGNAMLQNKTTIYGDAEVFDCAILSDATIRNKAKVSGSCVIHNMTIGDNAEISERFFYCAQGTLCGDAYIKSLDDVLVISNCCGDHTILTFFREKNGKIRVSCANGNNGRDGNWLLDDFVKYIPTLYRGNKSVQESLYHAVEIAKLRIK